MILFWEYFSIFFLTERIFCHSESWLKAKGNVLLVSETFLCSVGTPVGASH